MLSLVNRRHLAAAVVWLVSASMAVAESPLRAFVGQSLQARVTSIVDGDTVDVRLDDGSAQRVRLEGIDAPERGAPFSVQARNAARVALFDQAVLLRVTDVDRYRRLVARITANGRDTSIDLVRAGLACHFTRYSSDAALASAQADARAARVGFWSAGGRQPAACEIASTPARPSTDSVPRRNALSTALASEVVFHGNRRSKVYHAPSCRNYNCPNCVVVFKSHEEAQAAGFRPAGDCLR